MNSSALQSLKGITSAIPWESPQSHNFRRLVLVGNIPSFIAWHVFLQESASQIIDQFLDLTPPQRHSRWK